MCTRIRYSDAIYNGLDWEMISTVERLIVDIVKKQLLSCLFELIIRVLCRRASRQLQWRSFG